MNIVLGCRYRTFGGASGVKKVEPFAHATARCCHGVGAFGTPTGREIGLVTTNMLDMAGLHRTNAAGAAGCCGAAGTEYPYGLVGYCLTKSRHQAYTRRVECKSRLPKTGTFGCFGT